MGYGNMHLEVSYVIGRIIGGIMSGRLDDSQYDFEADVHRLSKVAQTVFQDKFLDGFESVVGNYPKYAMWGRKDRFVELCKETQTIFTEAVWESIFGQSINDAEYKGAKPFVQDSPEQLILELRSRLETLGYKEGDWDNGYVEDEIESALREINSFLAEKGFQGSLMIVWDFYDGLFGGNSDIHYHMAQTASAEIACSVNMPLFEDGLRPFIEDLLAADSGQKELEPFEPAYVGSYDYNACWEDKTDHTDDE